MCVVRFECRVNEVRFDAEKVPDCVGPVDVPTWLS